MVPSVPRSCADTMPAPATCVQVINRVASPGPATATPVTIRCSVPGSTVVRVKARSAASHLASAVSRAVLLTHARLFHHAFFTERVRPVAVPYPADTWLVYEAMSTGDTHPTSRAQPTRAAAVSMLGRL